MEFRNFASSSKVDVSDPTRQAEVKGQLVSFRESTLRPKKVKTSVENEPRRFGRREFTSSKFRVTPKGVLEPSGQAC